MKALFEIRCSRGKRGGFELELRKTITDLRTCWLLKGPGSNLNLFHFRFLWHYPAHLHFLPKSDVKLCNPASPSPIFSRNYTHQQSVKTKGNKTEALLIASTTQLRSTPSSHLRRTTLKDAKFNKISILLALHWVHSSIFISTTIHALLDWEADKGDTQARLEALGQSRLLIRIAFIVDKRIEYDRKWWCRCSFFLRCDVGKGENFWFWVNLATRKMFLLSM